MTVASDHPDLNILNGKTLREAGDTLRALGYNDEGGIFVHPVKNDHIIKLGPCVKAAASFAAIARSMPDNIFMPRIYATHDAGTIFVTVIEPLLNVRQREDFTRKPLVGTGRAVTLLLYGCDEHKAVHEFMMRNAQLRAAVQAIARAIADSGADNSHSALAYDTGVDHSQPLSQQEIDAVLFRIEHPRNHRPVFVAPFRTVSLRTAEDRLQHAEHSRHVLRRAGLAGRSSAPASEPQI